MEEIKEGYTRVSQIISQWNHLAHIDPHVLENKRRIGSEVHEKIAAESQGIFIPTEEETKGYIGSWLAWGKKVNPTAEYEIIEERLYCDELQITGALDAILRIGASSVIIDYKATASVHKKTWALQAAFYHYLAVKNGYGVDETVWFIQLKKDGGNARQVEIECTEELWEVAKSALHTYRYFNG